MTREIGCSGQGVCGRSGHHSRLGFAPSFARSEPRPTSGQGEVPHTKVDTLASLWGLHLVGRGQAHMSDMNECSGVPATYSKLGSKGQRASRQYHCKWCCTRQLAWLALANANSTNTRLSRSDPGVNCWLQITRSAQEKKSHRGIETSRHQPWSADRRTKTVGSQWVFSCSIIV